MAIVEAVYHLTTDLSSSQSSVAISLPAGVSDWQQCVPFISVAAPLPTGTFGQRNAFVQATMTNTAIRLARASATETIKVYVTLVEYKSGISVQATSNNSLGQVSTPVAKTFTTSVDTTRAFHYTTFYVYTTVNYYANVFLRSYFTSVTSGSTNEITYQRGIGSGNLFALSYVVEGGSSGTSAMPVQHGLTSIATGSRTKTATLTSVGSTSNAFPLLNYKMSGSSVTTTDPDEYSADGYMASATSLEVERAKAGSPNLDFSWQIVRTDANTGKTAHDRATVPTSVSGSYTYAENTIPGTWDLDQTSISPAIMQGIGRISGSYSDADERRAAPHLGILLSQSGSTTSLTYRAGDTSAVTWPQPRSPRASVVDWGPSTASSPPITVTEAEQVGVADSATVSLAKTETDQVGVADASASQAALVPADTVSVTDASASQAALAPAADTASITDQQASGVSLQENDSASVTDSSTISQSGSQQLTLSDAVSASDSTSASVQKAAQDSIALSDTQLSVVARILTPNFDRVVMSDGASSSIALSQSDSATVSDLQASGVSLQENDSASVTDSSTISQSGSPQLTLSDAVSASDSTSASVQKAAQDSITIAEDQAVAANWYRITQDRVDLTEVQSSSIEKREQDSVGAADDRAVTISLIVSDSVLVLDQAIQNPFRLQESIGVSDSVSIVTQISGIDSVTIRGRTSTVGLSGRSGSISLRGLSGTTQIKGRSLR